MVRLLGCAIKDFEEPRTCKLRVTHISLVTSAVLVGGGLSNLPSSRASIVWFAKPSFTVIPPSTAIAASPLALSTTSPSRTSRADSIDWISLHQSTNVDDTCHFFAAALDVGACCWNFCMRVKIKPLLVERVPSLLT